MRCSLPSAPWKRKIAWSASTPGRSRTWTSCERPDGAVAEALGGGGAGGGLERRPVPALVERVGLRERVLGLRELTLERRFALAA